MRDVVLPGEGFVLEPQAVAHADALFEVLQDPALYRHENAPPDSLEDFRRRLSRLESRRSADGREAWLNWVVRTADDDIAGYVQATVRDDGDALVAYVLGSRHWGRGLGSAAVARMLEALRAAWHVRRAYAMLKRSNDASRRLLERLHFHMATPTDHVRLNVEDDEWLYVRDLGDGADDDRT